MHEAKARQHDRQDDGDKQSLVQGANDVEHLRNEPDLLPVTPDLLPVTAPDDGDNYQMCSHGRCHELAAVGPAAISLSSNLMKSLWTATTLAVK